MSTTYRFAANVQAVQGWTEDDVLAVAVSTVDALTIVEHAEADHPMPGLWTVIVDFLGQGDAEARETARRAVQGLQSAGAGLSVDAPSLVRGRGASRYRVPLTPDFYPPVAPGDLPRNEGGLLG